jgi:hypothetical protein
MFVQPGTVLAYNSMGGFNLSTTEVVRRRIVVHEVSGIRRIVGYAEGSERFFPEAFVEVKIYETPEKDEPRYIMFREQGAQ